MRALKRIRLSWPLVVAPALLAGALVGYGQTDSVALPDDERLDVPVALEYPDASAREVFTALFQVLGAPCEIDACVSSRVSIELRNVTARDAIKQLSKMLDLRITSDGGTYVVTCRNQQPPTAKQRLDERVTLGFFVRSKGQGSPPRVLSKNWLTTPPLQKAQVFRGDPNSRMELGPDGSVKLPKRDEGASGPASYSVAVIYEPASEAEPPSARGTFTVRHYSKETKTVHSVTRPFDVALPNTDDPVDACEILHDGMSYQLAVVRAAPLPR
jgi:hypothetical protein